MENNKENKKIIVPTIIAVATLVILTIGAAYAYFTVTANNKFGTPSIEATTPEIGSVALTAGDNLTMSLTASQMMVGSKDVTYYASSEGTTTTATTANIGTATVTGAGSYTCDYTLTVEDNENSLYDAFQSMSTKSEGQIVLSINGSEYDFNTENLFSKTITRTMTGLTKNTPQNITAELTLVNKKSIDQSALADKTLTLTFTATNFKCTAEEENQGVSYVLENSSSSDLWNSELEDDGIRFVGTNPSNYVCFGYDDASEDCDFTEEENTDLYAYRIIGIFEDEEGIQHIKLIKKEALNTAYLWDEDSQIDYWENTSLYKGLNGISGGIYSNLFVGNETYNYMLISSDWYNKIATWNYTATNTKTEESAGPDYFEEKVQNIYFHEMNRSTKTNVNGEWDDVSAKIGLMYASDYALSLGETAVSMTGSTYTNASTLKTGWMHLSNNDSDVAESLEWTMTLYGDQVGDNSAYRVRSDGSIDDDYFHYEGNEGFVRPVFYLTSDVTISGEGTTTNPFIVS